MQADRHTDWHIVITIYCAPFLSNEQSMMIVRHSNNKSVWRDDAKSQHSNGNKEIVDGRHRLCALDNIYRWAKFGWNRCSSFDCYAFAAEDTHDAPKGPLYENLTSSTKPEVHNARYRQICGAYILEPQVKKFLATPLLPAAGVDIVYIPRDRFPRSILVTSSRGCWQQVVHVVRGDFPVQLVTRARHARLVDVTRMLRGKLVPWNASLCLLVQSCRQDGDVCMPGWRTWTTPRVRSPVQWPRWSLSGRRRRRHVERACSRTRRARRANASRTHDRRLPSAPPRRLPPPTTPPNCSTTRRRAARDRRRRTASKECRSTTSSGWRWARETDLASRARLSPRSALESRRRRQLRPVLGQVDTPVMIALRFRSNSVGSIRCGFVGRPRFSEVQVLWESACCEKKIHCSLLYARTVMFCCLLAYFCNKVHA